jgi:predicted nucleic acid-binding protein
MSPDPRPLVFLDTNVIIGYLRGKPSESRLFSDALSGRFRYAINPIVASELLLAGGARQQPRDLESLRNRLELLPINEAEVLLALPRIRGLRNRLAHSNDVLIFSSAAECDYLITRDEDFKHIVETDRPRVVTPEEFLEAVDR